MYIYRSIISSPQYSKVQKYNQQQINIISFIIYNSPALIRPPFLQWNKWPYNRGDLSTGGNNSPALIRPPFLQWNKWPYNRGDLSTGGFMSKQIIENDT